MCWAISTIERASRAAIVPMLTLSWLWASVEREWMLAGLHSFSASAVSAEQRQLHALEAVVQARLGIVVGEVRDQVRRQADVELLVDDQLELAVHQVAEVGQRDLQRVHAPAPMWLP